MRVAIFGNGEFDKAFTGLGLVGIKEILVQAESMMVGPLKHYCQENQIILRQYGIDWNNVDYPDAVIKTNKFGKQYDTRAPGRRNQTILSDSNTVVLLGNDVNQVYVEKSINWMKTKEGAIFDVLHWPVPVASDNNGGDDVPF